MRRSSGMLLLAMLFYPALAAADVRHDLIRDGRLLEIHISDQFNETSRQNLVEWITSLSDVLRTIYGHWPRQHWQTVISPAPASGDDPIPWAEVKRGETDSVNFYVSPTASANELKRAWTGYHEFAHLLIPYQGRGDSWFTEGLASYYQNVLQARSGVIDEQAMWQKLYDGYQRGRADTRFHGKPLGEVSQGMRHQGGFMRVYWSGAWYFLAADVRLRQQSRGRLSLDKALEQLNRCCSDQSLSVPAIVRKLDELNRVIMFQSLYDELIVSTEIPAYEPVFASLGITVKNGKVHLQQQGPGAVIRGGIAAGDTL